MLFNPFRLAGTNFILITMLLCGCASGPRLAFPVSLTKGLDGEVVSLKTVGQDGSGPVFQTARSVSVPQHWAQPQRSGPQRTLSSNSYASQRANLNQTQSPEVDPVPWIRLPVPPNTPTARPQYQQQVIRQVGQQQVQRTKSGPPLVIQWDDHKQSMGKVRTTRTYSAAPFDAPTGAIPSASGQEFCPPGPVSLPIVNQVGEGCGDNIATKDERSEQIDNLVKRVEKMESELTSSRMSMADLSRSLIAARTEITQLKKDVGFWQSEVLRLERSMQAQHQSDIESLNRISQVLENLLLEDQSATPTPVESPPDFDLAVDPFAPTSR